MRRNFPAALSALAIAIATAIFAAVVIWPFESAVAAFVTKWIPEPVVSGIENGSWAAPAIASLVLFLCFAYGIGDDIYLGKKWPFFMRAPAPLDERAKRIVKLAKDLSSQWARRQALIPELTNCAEQVRQEFTRTTQEVERRPKIGITGGQMGGYRFVDLSSHRIGMIVAPMELKLKNQLGIEILLGIRAENDTWKNTEAPFEDHFYNDRLTEISPANQSKYRIWYHKHLAIPETISIVIGDLRTEAQQILIQIENLKVT